MYSWGSGKYGQLGLGDETNWCRLPHLVKFPAKVAIKQIATGFHHVLALAGTLSPHPPPHPQPGSSLSVMLFGLFVFVLFRALTRLCCVGLTA